MTRKAGAQAKQPASDTKAVRVLVVEDHPIVQEALSSRLRNGGLEVVGVCSSGEEALECYADLRPDVVTCDVHLGPGSMTGVEVVAKLRGEDPNARVIMFSARDDDTSIHASLDAGACGYVLKTVTAPELVECVQQAAEGQTVFDRATAAKVIAALRSRGNVDAVHLSPRETEVLKLMMRGVTSTRDIASTLYVSMDTAKTHCERILAKLGVNDRAQAVAMAFRDKIVELD